MACSLTSFLSLLKCHLTKITSLTTLIKYPRTPHPSPLPCFISPFSPDYYLTYTLNIYFLSVTPPHTHTCETPEFMVYKGRILSVLLITAAPALILMPGIFDRSREGQESGTPRARRARPRPNARPRGSCPPPPDLSPKAPPSGHQSPAHTSAPALGAPPKHLQSHQLGPELPLCALRTQLFSIVKELGGGACEGGACGASRGGDYPGRRGSGGNGD